MKNKSTVVLDIDGVICNFEEAFCDAFGYKNRHLYKLEGRYPQYNPSLIGEWVNQEENYHNLSPIFGGVLLIQQLKERGWDVVLMTSRPKHLEAVTKSWLTLFHIDVGVLFETDKAKTIQRHNGQVYLKSPVTLFVDDSVSQLKKVNKLNPSVTCLAWGQDWNRGYHPRLRYNNSNYKIEANVGNGQWKHIWEYN